jgi:hypothetical protein
MHKWQAVDAKVLHSQQWPEKASFQAILTSLEPLNQL